MSLTQLITVLDSENPWAAKSGVVYRWNSCANTNECCSILSYCEENAERLREKYCKWVYDLGNFVVGRKRLVEHLSIDDSFSYWWMTLLVEKCLWKSPSINNAIRLLALEEILLQNKPKQLLFVSADCNLNESIRTLCENLGVVYEWKHLPKKRTQTQVIRQIYHILPHGLQALIGLARYLWTRWPLRQSKKTGWFGDAKSLFICSYFFNIDPQQASEGLFYSRYWEGLHGLMEKRGVLGNWLQIYCPHDVVPSPRVAMDLVKRFNQQHERQEFHGFLDSYLSWRVVFRVLSLWFKFTLISRRLRTIKVAFHPQGSKISFWPLIRGDWKKSICGEAAINNFLWIELFDKAMQDMPHQKKGLYLCENQAWERALIHFWHKHGHGQLIAVPHTTRSFWDLRFFRDNNIFKTSLPYPLPQADLIAVNGKASLVTFLSENYPRECLVECEALRYNYLSVYWTQNSLKKIKEGSIKVLILGDYTSSNTIKMLHLLEEANSTIPECIDYTIKPHPNFLVMAKDYPSLNLNVVTESLSKIIHQFDLAYSSSNTSAAVDAYLAGLPVVVMRDETKLNLSPLRNQPGVCFVSLAKELSDALKVGGCRKESSVVLKNFFFLDPELPRWQKLLFSAMPN